MTEVNTSGTHYSNERSTVQFVFLCSKELEKVFIWVWIYKFTNFSLNQRQKLTHFGYADLSDWTKKLSDT